MGVKNVSFQHFGGQVADPEKTLAEARREAERLVNNARGKAAEIEQTAYQAGFSQGEQAGLKVGMASAQPSIDGVAVLVEELNRLLLSSLEAMEPEIIRMVQLVAQRVIHTTIAADDEVLLRVIRAAMAEVDKQWDVTVRVNPQELDTIQTHEAALAALRENAHVKLVADPAVEAGGCVVQAPTGFVNASVRQALDNLFAFEE